MRQTRFSDDLVKFRFFEDTLYTAVVSDILDGLGLKDRVLQASIRPLNVDNVVAGRVRTMLWADVFEVYEHPYKIEIAAMDSLKSGDVLVHAGNSTRYAAWGALMTTAAIARSARGAILDGYVRDVREIAGLGFPVFAAGVRPLDSRGRGHVIDFDCPVECGGVDVLTGDLVFADYDGVVVIPRDVEDEVLALAIEKVEKENLSMRDLRDGLLLKDVYAKHGVL